MTLWSLILKTDIISKIVLSSLLSLSFISWTLALYKIKILNLKTKLLKEAQPLLFHLISIEDIVNRASTLQNGFTGELLAHYLTELKKAFKLSNLQSFIPAKKMGKADFERFSNSIEQTAINALESEERIVPLFSTLAQVGPLLGLFGTVWGLIHAFMSIAQEGSIDITSIAPGIAEALITTLAGLVVAIPALVLFNYILGKVKLFEQQLIALTQIFLDSVHAISVTDVSDSNIFGPNGNLQTNSAVRESVFSQPKMNQYKVQEEEPVNYYELKHSDNNTELERQINNQNNINLNSKINSQVNYSANKQLNSQEINQQKTAWQTDNNSQGIMHQEVKQSNANQANINQANLNQPNINHEEL